MHSSAGYAIKPIRIIGSSRRSSPRKILPSPWSREESKRPGAPLRTVVAGQSGRTGQKVWNLLAALDAIEDQR